VDPWWHPLRTANALVPAVRMYDPETLTPGARQSGNASSDVVGLLPQSSRARRIAMALAVAGVLATLPTERPASAQQPSHAATVSELFGTEPASLPLPIRQERPALNAYYVDRSSEPVWASPERRLDFIGVLKNAHREGLEPASYPIDQLEKLNRFVAWADRLTKAEVELYFSAIFLSFARDLKVGRFLPTRIDPKLYWQTKTIDPQRAFSVLKAAPKMIAFVESWQPQIAECARLRSVLAHYRAIEVNGGWPTVPHVELLKPEERHAVVPALHARLAVTDAALGAEGMVVGDLYGGQLVEAVKRFQAGHGLEADGVVGKQTLFAMNISVADRIRQIILTMERWRWMPESLGEDHIHVNIAGYQLRRVRAGRVEEAMRVVVGKPYHQTPVFSDEIEYLEFNPYWNVPHSIAVREELPKLRENAAARAARGFEAVVNGKAVDLTAIDWTRVSATNFSLQLRQKPGPDNALGRVKFMFPNRFNVYLHDTPAHSLFARAQRAFSHGCIRLARPIDLAGQVLAVVPGWPRSRIDDVLQGKQRTVVRLPKALPVHLTYATVWLGQDGVVQFRPDIYGRDAKLEKALIGRYARL
jgi:murein L,D-transpeptidase YcbB/YkuD